MTGRPAVVVDGSVFEHHGNLGIWRVFYEVLSRIGTELDIVLWLRSPPVRPLPPGVRLIRDSARYYCPRYDVIGRVRRAVSRRRVPAEVRSARLFHPTFMTRPPTSNIQEIVTIHDMIQERYYSISGSWALDHIGIKREAVISSRICICISNATADDLERFYPGVVGKTRICLNGADHFSTDLPSCLTATPPYTLFVGARGGHKNFVTLVEAMMCSDWPASLPLWVVGPQPADYEVGLVRYHGLGNRVRFLGPVADAELRQLYRSARCFIYPSLCEGFGIPVLEAQANGAPVVISDIPAFREVGSTESAVYFDPRSSSAMAVAVAEAVGGVERERRIEAGLENVKRFRWADCAAATLEAYHAALA